MTEKEDNTSSIQQESIRNLSSQSYDYDTCHPSPAVAGAIHQELISFKDDKRTTSLRNCPSNALSNILSVLYPVVLIPLYVVYASAAYFFFDVNVFGNDNVDAAAEDSNQQGKQPEKISLYEKAQEFQKTARMEAKLAVVSVIWMRLVILSIALLVPALSVPELRSKVVLGSKLWQWTLLLMLVCCGYPLVSVATRMLLYLMASSDEIKGRRYAVYYAGGLRRSVNYVILSGSVLLAWGLHFWRTARLDTVTWTFVAFLVGSALWLIKNVLLLNWLANAVYKRFSERILRVGFQLYFVALIDGRRFDEFEPSKGEGSDDNADCDFRSKVDKERPPSTRTNRPLTLSPSDLCTYNVNIIVPITTMRSQDWEAREEKKRKAKQILLIKRRKASKEASTYDIKQKAKYFVNLYVVSSREGDGISDLQNKFNEQIPMYRDHITKEDLKNHFGFDEEDANLLYSDELQVEDSSVPYQTFEKWMFKAHKNCLVLGYTLSDAKGVVKILDKVMTGVWTIVVVMIWLLLTKIATTQMLVLIASPLLAATFVFSDTCKRVFEGLMFSFINHPFDVGDRCIIDGNEVKRMGILTTTFMKIGPRPEEALYPNSVLAMKSITNLKGDPDPDDVVELTLDSNSTTKPALDALQSKIKKFLEDNPRYEQTNSSTVVKEIGTSIKMTIRYGHVLSIQEVVTHMQCFEKKSKQRSEFLLQIKQFLDDLQIKVAAITF